MSVSSQRRLTLLLAVLGALLITVSALERSARFATDPTLPAFKRSQPPLDDWPRHPPGYRA